MRLGLLGALLALGVLFVHVPATLWAGNVQEFESGRTLLALGLAATVIGLGAVAVALRLVPRRWRPGVASLASAIGIVWWVQAYFFVGHLALLDGRQAPMDFSAAPGAGQLALVAALCLALAIVVFRWPRPAAAALLLLNLGLTAGTIVTVWRAPGRPAAPVDVNTPAILRFAPHDNVLIVLLDTLQSDVTDRVFRHDATLRGAFDGFQFYKDTLSSAPSTFLSVPAIHSGEAYSGQGAVRPYFTDAIAHRSFLSLFANAGYEPTLINPIAGICPDGVTTCFDTSLLLHSADARLTRESLRLLDLSLFRVSPAAAKRRIYADGRWLTTRLVTVPHEVSHIVDGNAFLEQFTRRLTVSPGPPTIKFLHLMSTHPPFVLDEHCRLVSTVHDLARAEPQARCALEAVAGLFDRMKRAGIYDDALILVMADHGVGLPNGYAEGAARAPADWLDLAGFANPTFLLKPRGRHGAVADAPGAVHLADVGATLCAASAACTAPRGIAAGQAPDDRSRRFTYYTWSNDYWDTYDVPDLTAYDIRGPLWTEEAWSRTRIEPYRLGDVITFGTGGTSHRYVQFGWGAPEPWGRWTSHDVARLALHLDGPVDRSLELVAHVYPFLVPPQQRQAVTWSVDEGDLATWTFTDPHPSERRVTIPASAVDADGNLRLTLHVAAATSQQELGSGTDARRLGVGFVDLMLTPQPDETAHATEEGDSQ